MIVPPGESLPLYMEIRREIEDQILSGKLKPGHKLPAEREIQLRFGCSRMTVNKAISALSAGGMVVRQRRSGTFVASPHAQQPLLEIRDIRAEIIQSGRSYRYDVVARRIRRAGAGDAARMPVPVRTLLLHIEIVHYADEKPSVLEDRLINLQAVPAAAEEPFEYEPPGTWLLRHVSWTQAEHRISARALDETLASRLQLGPNRVALVLERHTWQAGTPITHVRLLYPGERYELIARFAPGQ